MHIRYKTSMSDTLLIMFLLIYLLIGVKVNDMITLFCSPKNRVGHWIKQISLDDKFLTQVKMRCIVYSLIWLDFKIRFFDASVAALGTLLSTWDSYSAGYDLLPSSNWNLWNRKVSERYW
jgi:hypothetical protein